MDEWIYLASASPRRSELLTQIGIAHRQRVSDIPESPGADESAEAFAIRLARAKAEAVAAVTSAEPKPVVGADTVVVVDGEPLGKPTDRQHAAAMLSRLAGRSHQVVTAVAVAFTGAETRHRLSISTVHFRPISTAEIDAYWASGEPADKAGGYAIQGIGALFVTHLDGSYSGVMGLPLFETAELLGRYGLDPLLGASRSINE